MDFQKADLSGANLEGASLNRANLKGADLSHADLSYADLRSADLGEATLSHSAIAAVDLSVAKGLGECTFVGPSHISTSTFQMSNGQIPESFLRGCGLADWEVESAKLYNADVSAAEIVDIHQRVFELRNGKSLQFCSVFISYGQQDKAFAQRLFDALQAEGVRCWLDEKQMQPGDDVYEGVDRGIKHWDKVLLCASKHSLTSWWVDSEVNRVLEKERSLSKERDKFSRRSPYSINGGKKVLALIPLNLDGYLLDGYEGAKADEVRSRIAADFTSGANFDAAVEMVIKALRADDDAREALRPELL